VDRQARIDEILRQVPLTRDELRRVLMIAGLTLEEYLAVGTRIRVHRVKEMGGDAVEITLHGGWSDAQYVQGAIKNQKDVETTDPQPVQGADGVFMSFRARGSQANPLTKEKAMRVLSTDPCIEVMSNA
jgi:hypothetical protein